MATKQKPKRKLKNVIVDEISLVDKGAVEAADFVVLSKRIETEPEVPEENQESEIVQIAKAMDEESAYEATNVLRLMADITSLATTMKKCLKRLPEDLQKAFGDLKSAMYDEKVEKAEDEEEEVAEQTPVKKNEAPVKKTSAEQFAEAMELLDKREQERAEREDAEALNTVISKVDAVLNGYAETQTALDERLNQLEKALSREQGNDDDD